MVVLRQNWLHSGTVVLIAQIMVVFGQSGCIRAKVVVFEQKWLYSGKVIVFGQKWFYSGKSCCIRAK